MIKFIKKVFLLIFILSFCFSIIAFFDFFVVGNQYAHNYQASLIDKVERLKSINEPKIILVGNSNLSFGIDSQMIEEVLKMPVVNLGLHGGLGNAFHEEIAKKNINAGDIIIVCHTDYNDSDKIDDTPLAWITVDNNIDLWKIIRKKDYYDMLKAYPDFLKKSVSLWITHQGNRNDNGCYSRHSFNKYGDVVYKPESGQVNVDKFFSNTAVNKVEKPTVGETCINRLNDYNQYIKNKGATLLIAGYPIAYGKYTQFSSSDLIHFKKELEDKLDCEVISDFADYCFPYEYFYDTRFHLTKQGAERRTKQLISDIEKWKRQH